MKTPTISPESRRRNAQILATAEEHYRRGKWFAAGWVQVRDLIDRARTNADFRVKASARISDRVAILLEQAKAERDTAEHLVAQIEALQVSWTELQAGDAMPGPPVELPPVQ